jgi:hypothetical protein
MVMLIIFTDPNYLAVRQALDTGWHPKPRGFTPGYNISRPALFDRQARWGWLWSGYHLFFI